MEAKRCREELRVLHERLENSERGAEAVRRDLSELGALQIQNQAELHQIRLQAAQSTLQLSQANLNLREGQAAWAKERENLRRNAEVRTRAVTLLPVLLSAGKNGTVELFITFFVILSVCLIKYYLISLSVFIFKMNVETW